MTSSPVTSKAHKHERGQGLVEYALILVLVAVVVIAVLGVAGKGVAGVFCTVTSTISKTTPAACQTAPKEGDVCVSYTFEPHAWYYIWRYNNGSWARIAEIGGVRPTCSFSDNPDNHSRDPYI